MPIRTRSSGMCATPSFDIARGDQRLTSRPPSVRRPRSTGRSPVSASTSSRCPLPATPAMPKISCRCTTTEIPRTAGSPRSLWTHRSSAMRAGAPVPGRRAGSRKSTSCPTIIRANWLLLVMATGTVSTTRPLRITVTRSATAMTSSSLCVIKMTDLPSSFIRRRTANSCVASCGVKTLVGSSRIRMPAPRSSAFRISTRCCSLTDSCQIAARGSTRRP